MNTHKLLPYIPVFRLVASQGSFQAAANALNIPRSSVSKKISQLESLVGQRLFQRTTRKLVITESGQQLLCISEGLPTLLDGIETFVSAQQSEPSGKVKISCSTLIGHQYLLPHVQELKTRYPKIVLELSFTDSYVDLMEELVDIAIRVGNLPDSPMLARKIGDKSLVCVANPDYLRAHGTPLTPEDLEAHQCLVFKSKSSNHSYWHFQNPEGNTLAVQVRETLICDDARALMEMVKSGLGITMVDPQLIRKELETGELIQILEPFSVTCTQPVQLVCLGRATRSKAAKVIWEELANLLPPHFR
ncbi:LysR family transcriptional regulator [Vibrio nigripulchritudo]|nr:LysR family transcriptional regulator [Vibrio nigripulchritudo]